jgi:hypothetical protein
MAHGEQYELTIVGRPGPRILEALPGFETVSCEGGHAVLRGWIRDQAALQGIVRSLGDLGVAIESLQRIDTAS